MDGHTDHRVLAQDAPRVCDGLPLRQVHAGEAASPGDPRRAVDDEDQVFHRKLCLQTAHQRFQISLAQVLFTQHHPAAAPGIEGTQLPRQRLGRQPPIGDCQQRRLRQPHSSTMPSKVVEAVA